MTIFELFASKNDRIPQFKKPFYLNDKTVAVGVSRMVWVDGQVGGVEMIGLGDYLGAEVQSHIDALEPDAVFERVDVDMPKHKACVYCDSGRVLASCPECYGSGEIKTHTDFSLYTNACQTCLGTGKPVENRHGACLKCDETGVSVVAKKNGLPGHIVNVMGVQVDARQLAGFYSDDTVFYVNPDKPDTLYFKDYDCTGLVKAVA